MFDLSSSESFQRRSGRPTVLVPVVMKDGYIRRVMQTTRCQEIRNGEGLKEVYGCGERVHGSGGSDGVMQVIE